MNKEKNSIYCKPIILLHSARLQYNIVYKHRNLLTIAIIRIIYLKYLLHLNGIYWNLSSLIECLTRKCKYTVNGIFKSICPHVHFIKSSKFKC